MSYADCMARISQLDALLRSMDPTWATSGRSLVSTAGQGLSSASPFAGVLESVSATTATATAATTSKMGMGAGDVAAAAAIALVGKIPYSYGASAEQTAARSGADCSSFIQYIESLVGVNLSRTADAQYKDTQAQAVSKTDLKTGDLLFFGGWNDPSNPPGYAGIQHVAMYIGNGKLVQEGGSNNNVNVANVADFGSYFMYATRPSASGRLPDPATLLAPSSGDPAALTPMSGSAALARFDAVSSQIPYAAEIRSAAIANGIDPLLLASLVYAESNFNATAVSGCGAQGLTQLMPGTAAELGVTDPFDPQQNLNGGAAYLATQMKRFGRTDLALAAYNAGPGYVSNLGAVPSGCQYYIHKILDQWQSYQEPLA